MIQDQSEAIGRVGEEEQEAGASQLVVVAEKRLRGVSVSPVGTTMSLVRPDDWKRMT